MAASKGYTEKLRNLALPLKEETMSLNHRTRLSAETDTAELPSGERWIPELF